MSYEAHNNVWGATPYLRVFVAICVLSHTVFPTIVAAQVTEATGVHSLDTGVTINGPTYEIRGGTRPNTEAGDSGANLFHGFEHFSIPENHIGKFINDDGHPTSNIISRVTGGNLSEIHGTIDTTDFANANLFLLNPAGILFGANARLDVSGSFYATTADYLLFGEEQFGLTTDPTDNFSFSVPDISAFGFSESPNPIRVEGSMLFVPDGETLALVAGQSAFGPGTKAGVHIENAQLEAISGTVSIVSIGSPGIVPTDAKTVQVNSDNSLGDVHVIRNTPKKTDIFAGAATEHSPGGGGSIVIRGGALTFDNVNLSARTITHDSSGGIDIRGRTITLNNDANFLSETQGEGNAGTITLDARNRISLNDRSTISTSVFQDNASGRGGDITITANTLHMNGTSGIESNTNYSPSGEITVSERGHGGDITIDVASMTLNDSATISAQSKQGGGGNAGNISVTARSTDGTGALTLNSGTSINTSAGGRDFAGNAGELTIITDTFNMHGGSLSASTSSRGDGAAIDLTATTVNLSNEASVTTDTIATGKAGDIVFNVGTLVADSATLSSSSNTTSAAPTALTGAVGSITIQGVQTNADGTEPAARVALTNTTVATTLHGQGRGADTTGDGLGNQDPIRADITMTAQDVQLDNGTTITADTTGTGDAGIIAFDVDQLTSNIQRDPTTHAVRTDSDGLPLLATNHAPVDISSNTNLETAGGGHAGSIEIDSPVGPIYLHNTHVTTAVADGGDAQGGVITASSGGNMILSDTTVSANVYDKQSPTDDTIAFIGLSATGGLFIDGGRVSATSNGSRDAGGVILDAAGMVLNNTTLDAAAFATGGGGGVLLSSENDITLADTTLFAEVANGLDTTDEGTGFIGVETAGTLTMTNSTVQASSFGTRQAGNIFLSGDEAVTVDDTILLSSSSKDASGNAGNVDVFSNGPIVLTNGTDIDTRAEGTGNAGAIFVTSQDGILITDTFMDTAAVGTGDAGEIFVDSAESILIADSFMTTDAEDTGAGGRIFVNSLEDILITGSALTAEVVNGFDTIEGGTGFIEINASGTLAMTNSVVTADSFGTRQAGNILLAGTETTTVDDTILLSSSSKEASGNAGNVAISSDGPIALTNGTDIDTRAEGTGNAGGIFVNSADSILIADSFMTTDARTIGTGGGIFVDSLEDILITGSTLTAEVVDGIDTTEEGTGRIGVEAAGTLTVIDSELSARSHGQRHGGDIELNAQEITAAGTTTRSTISSSSTNTDEGSGNAGNITILAGTIDLSSTDVLTTVDGDGQGGSINITATDAATLTLDNTKVEATVNNVSTSESTAGLADVTLTSPTIHVLNGSQVSAITTGTRQGGSILLDGSETLSRNPNFGSESLLVDGGTITAESQGPGNAGTIDLQSGGTLRVTDQSLITTNADQATGGQITLQSDFLVHTIDSTIESSVQGNTTDSDGGNIVLQGGDFVVLQNSRIEANAVQGDGGRIDIISPIFLRDSISIPIATSEFGISGTVNIDSPIQNLSGAIAPLPEAIVQVATLYGDQCAAQEGGDASSFSRRGRDRIPFEPGDPLLTPLQLRPLDPDLPRTSSTSASPMAQRLGLATGDHHPHSAFTSFSEDGNGLAIFHGGCRPLS